MTPFTTRRRRFQAALLATLLPLIGFAQGTAPTGSGTAGDPYIIDSADDLVYLSGLDAGDDTYLTGTEPIHYEQTADIDLAEASFNGIPGSSDNGITWNYDGGGYTIANMDISISGESEAGFLQCAKGGSIQDLTLLAPQTSLTNSSGTNTNAAILIGLAMGNVTLTDITLINPHVLANSASAGTASDAGGMIGMLQNASGDNLVSIANCSILGGQIYVDIASGGSYQRAGGFVGGAYRSGTHDSDYLEISQSEVHNLSICTHLVNYVCN